MITESETVSAAQIIADYKSLATFRHRFIKAGYIVPDLVDLSWTFVFAFVAGTKKLIEKPNPDTFMLPPR